MAAYEVLLLNTAIPQIQAAQSGDTYVVPRAIAFNAGVNVVNNDVTIYGVTVGRGAGAVASNTAVGASALAANTSGSENVSLGYQSLQANTTASNNTAVGYQAGYTNSTGAANTFVGRQAGYSATGTANTFVGQTAGYYSTGSYNTFVGTGSTNAAGDAVTTGSKNTILGGYGGNQGGLDIRTASNYIVLSDGDGNPRLVGDGAGNFAFGSAPVSWNAPPGNALQVVSSHYFGDSGQAIMTQNAYYNSAWLYQNTAQASNYTQVAGEHRWYTAPSGTAGASITFTQSLAFGKGTSLALEGASTQSGTGITFPATQNASSNANTLDDYEEGTWTPTLDNFTLGNGTATGYYTKVGNLITCNFIITFGSTSSITGTPLQISGLPVAISDGVAGMVDLLDAGTQQYLAGVQAGNNVSALNIRAYLANGTYVEATTLSSTVPFTWTTSDSITGFVSYRAL